MQTPLAGAANTAAAFGSSTYFEHLNFLPQILHQPLQPLSPLIESWIRPWHSCTQRYLFMPKSANYSRPVQKLKVAGWQHW